MKKTAQKTPAAAPESNAPPQSSWPSKLLHIVILTLAIGTTYPIMLILLGALSNVVAPVHCSSTYGCGESTRSFYISFVATAILTCVAGSFFIRSLLKSKWITCFFAPFIGFTTMFSCGIVAVGVYGEHVLGYPLYLIMASFFISFAAIIFLLDAIKSTAWSCVIAIAILVLCATALPVCLASTAQVIWISHGLARAEKLTDVSVPRFAKNGTRLGSVTTSPTNQSYMLVYYNGLRFSPFARSSEVYRIDVDAPGVYNPPKTCGLDYAKSPAAPILCRKIGTAKECDVFKSDTNSFYSASYTCAVRGKLFSLFGGNVSDDEALKIFDSLQPVK